MHACMNNTDFFPFIGMHTVYSYIMLLHAMNTIFVFPICFCYTGYSDLAPDSTAVIIVTTKEVLLIDRGTIIANETLPSTVQVPELSALTHTATMAVFNRIAHFAGLNGTTYKITVQSDDMKVYMRISNVTLDIPCITESFAYTNTGTSASCYWNDTNSLYIVSLNLLSERQSFRFTDQGYTSMIVPVDDVFYYVHNYHLIKANLIGHLTVETLENCEYPLLVSNPYHYIVIQCYRTTSKVYVPEEWNTADGFREGGWKDSNKTLYPCHGTGFAPLVYSTNGRSMMTFYDIRNNFRQTVTLQGNAVIDTLTCVLNDDQLILIYADESCDCWMQHVLNEDYEYTASYPIPGANGTLPPYTLENNAVAQKVLVFQYRGSVQYVMVPSTRQVLVDIAANGTYTDITSDVVFYYGLFPLNANGNADTLEDDSSTFSKHWGLFLGGTVFVVILLAATAPFVTAAAHKLYKWDRRLVG